MSFDFGISLISASLTAVKSINDGSFFLPLFGTGAKKGLSVSINTFSRGNDLKVSCKSKEFLKVIIPLAEIKEIPKSKLVEITTNNFNQLFFN